MKIKYILIFILVLIIPALVVAKAYAGSHPDVRVAIVQGVETINLKVAGAYEVTNPSKSKVLYQGRNLMTKRGIDRHVVAELRDIRPSKREVMARQRNSRASKRESIAGLRSKSGAKRHAVAELRNSRMSKGRVLAIQQGSKKSKTHQVAKLKSGSKQKNGDVVLSKPVRKNKRRVASSYTPVMINIAACHELNA